MRMRRRGAKLPKQHVKKKSGCKVIPGHSGNYRKSRLRGNRTKCNQNTNASRQKRARMHYKAHRQKTLSPMIYQDSSPKTAPRTLNHKWKCAPAENPRNTQVQKKWATKKKAPQNAREKKTVKNLLHITANLAEHLHVFRSYMLSRSLLLCPVSGSLHELSTSHSFSAIGSSYDNGGTSVLTIMNIIIIIIIPLSLPLHFRRGRRRAAFVPWVPI